MKKAFYPIVLTVSLMIAPLHAEFRSWTNNEGVKVDAELVKAESGNVTLRLRNGKLSTFTQSKLSPADQDFIKENKESKSAPNTPQAEPTVEANRRAKWLSKMEKAQEQSKETGLPIFTLFTGTSWCPYCIQLEDEVFSKAEFKTFANQNLVLLILDFGPGGVPSSKKDGILAKEFGVTGYPSYFLIDTAGKRLASGGYHKGINPKGFAEWVKSASPKK